jgi:hypothetical protein
MAISSTKPITILDALEPVLVAQALQLLGWESYNRANDDTLEHLRPIIDKLRETGEERAASPRGQKVGEPVNAADDVWVTTAEASKATGMKNVRGVHRAIEAGGLEGRRFGQRTWQVSVTSVDGYNERHKRKGAA